VELLRATCPGKRLLLVLHKRRLKEADALAPAGAAFLEGLRRAGELYTTPYGSNDDWYWLYATVAARGAGLLVSNDELRDHIFQLLRPKHFLKWKQRHIARYGFAHAGGAAGYLPHLSLPRPYTACVQELEASGAWMLPAAAGERWLCVRPVAADGASAGGAA